MKIQRRKLVASAIFVVVIFCEQTRRFPKPTPFNTARTPSPPPHLRPQLERTPEEIEAFKAEHGQDEFDEYTAVMLKEKLKVRRFFFVVAGE